MAKTEKSTNEIEHPATHRLVVVSESIANSFEKLSEAMITHQAHQRATMDKFGDLLLALAPMFIPPQDVNPDADGFSSDDFPAGDYVKLSNLVVGVTNVRMPAKFPDQYPPVNEIFAAEISLNGLTGCCLAKRVNDHGNQVQILSKVYFPTDPDRVTHITTLQDPATVITLRGWIPCGDAFLKLLAELFLPY